MSDAVFFLISCRIIDWLGSVGELVLLLFFWSDCITAFFFYAFVSYFFCLTCSTNFHARMKLKIINERMNEPD